MSRSRFVVATVFFASALAAAGCSLLTDFSSLTTNEAADGGGMDGRGTVDAGQEGATGEAGTDGGDADECTTPGLVALWRMDDGAGAIVKDCSPNALHGTVLTGTAAWVPGHRGGGLQLDGRTCIDMGDHAELAPTKALTVTLWLSNLSFVATGDIAYAVGKRAFAKAGYRLGMRSDTPSFELGNDVGQMFDLAGTTTQPLGKFTHLAATFEPGRTALYVNGEFAGSRVDQISQTVPTSTSAFRIGCSGSAPPDSFLNAIVDDVRLYDRALSPAEISALAR